MVQYACGDDLFMSYIVAPIVSVCHLVQLLWSFIWRIVVIRLRVVWSTTTLGLGALSATLAGT